MEAARIQLDGFCCRGWFGFFTRVNVTAGPNRAFVVVGIFSPIHEHLEHVPVFGVDHPDIFCPIIRQDPAQYNRFAL